MNRCIMCGRVLTAEESLDRWIGPECARRLAGSRDGKSPLCLDLALSQIQDFMARAGAYLDNEALTKLHQEAQPLVERILRYSSDMRAETLWSKATRNQKQVAEEMERAIEHLAGVAGSLAVDGERDWRRSSDAWRPILAAMDAACGYRLVQRGVHLRMARLYRSKGSGKAAAGKARSLPPLLALLEGPEPAAEVAASAAKPRTSAPTLPLGEELCPLPLTSVSTSATAAPLSEAGTRPKTVWL